MVDRVGSNPGYGYPQVNDKKVNTNTAGTGEKFQLDYGKEGAIYEPSSEALKKQQAEKSPVTRVGESPKAEEDGVRLTLSGTALEHNKSEVNTDAFDIGGIWDAVTGVVNRAIDVIKRFISSIWNDEPKTIEKAEQEENTIIAEEMKAEKPQTQFEKAKAEAEAFLASAEGKKAARNSDLLTYYDKHGTVINVSPSDRQRILYGDKNQIEV